MERLQEAQGMNLNHLQVYAANGRTDSCHRILLNARTPDSLSHAPGRQPWLAAGVFYLHPGFVFLFGSDKQKAGE